MYQVYAVINKYNSKMYIGSTERKLQKRWQRHVAKAKEGSLCTLHKAIRKYGQNNFDIRMIEEYHTREDMFVGEIGWIAYFDTYKSSYGYNDTTGGDGGNTNGGKKFSEEWKMRISKSLAGKSQIDRRIFSEKIEKEICSSYIKEEKSTYNLGKNYNCSRNTINALLKRYNIDIRKSNYTGHNNGKNLFSLEEEMKICNLYLYDNISRTELSRKFNCGKTTVRDILIRHKIKL